MKWWKYIAVGIVLVWMVAGQQSIPSGTQIGKIKEIRDVPDQSIPVKEATVAVDGKQITASYYVTDVVYTVGDTVLIENNNGVVIITDFYRTPALKSLFGLFLIIVFLITDIGGLRSLAGLAASFAIIFNFVLPQIAAGSHPLVVVMTASIGILFISYYLTHGFSTKTTIAVTGTFAALLITGILTMIFGAAAKLTGFGNEEASFLQSQLNAPINIYNLLIAGIIIGALGVLDDITIAQASVVAELKTANSKLGMRELFVRGMRVGHDHIASLVNTLVLVYTGTSLPLLLLFVSGQRTWTSLINYEPVAEEIVRTVVGSIGLIAAVPITTALAAYWYSTQRD